MKRILLVLCLLLFSEISYAKSFIELTDADHTIINLNSVTTCSENCGHRRDGRHIYYQVNNKHYWLRYGEDDYAGCMNDYKRLRNGLFNIDYDNCIKYGGGKGCVKYK